jgi:hypothetical protein
MKRWAILWALAAFLVLPAAAQDQQEEITDYASDMSVARNGVLTVTETIAVISTGDQIRHGIYRDFPTTYTDKLGRGVHVRFDVVGATRDGHAEPYSTESVSTDATPKGVRVKIGDPDIIVDPGPHTYTLSYITDRQVGFFDTYDELYWNVTGNGWIFPIRHASAVIHLPAGAEIKQSSFYTGPVGATGRSARSEIVSSDTIRFETTDTLGANEGLTVAVGFSKGAVTPPSAATLRAEFIRDNAGMVVAALGILVLTLFYLGAWWQHGRDPRHGTIIPLFAPPADLSPESVRYIHRMSYDRKSFAAALINMAVKGYIKIREVDGKYTIERTANRDAIADLSKNERAMAQALMGDRNVLVLEQSNHDRVSRAITALQSGLKSECERHYFVTNHGWFLAGLGILLVTGIGAALLSDQPEVSGFLMVWITGWSVGTFFLMHQVVLGWMGVFSGGPGSRLAAAASALFMSLFALPFVGGLVGALAVFGGSLSPITTAFLVAGGGLAVLFYHLLKAPTALGAPIMDQIEGFKLFLNTAEKDRLEALNPPNITPEVFEKFLPYAIALDCENNWSKRFEAEAAAAANAPGSSTGYTPVWYSGPSFNQLGYAGFASAIGSSIGNAAASSSVAPGSSSGSGGGGFSGGGGGGGGGGGW